MIKWKENLCYCQICTGKNFFSRTKIGVRQGHSVIPSMTVFMVQYCTFFTHSEIDAHNCVFENW